MSPSLILPRQTIHSSLKQPFIGLFYQAGANGIFTDVSPFLVIIFAASQTRVPEIPLPLAGFGQMKTAQFAFPKQYPSWQGYGQISRRTKQVEVVWHQQIIADEPGVG